MMNNVYIYIDIYVIYILPCLLEIDDPRLVFYSLRMIIL